MLRIVAALAGVCVAGVALAGSARANLERGSAPEMVRGLAPVRATGGLGEAQAASTEEEPITIGSLDKSLIDAVIQKHMAEIDLCYQHELTKTPSLAGNLTVKFTIATNGSVSDAVTKTTTLNNPAVESCVIAAFMRMTFPQPKGGGVVIASYPFVFSPR